MTIENRGEPFGMVSGSLEMRSSVYARAWLTRALHHLGSAPLQPRGRPVDDAVLRMALVEHPGRRVEGDVPPPRSEHFRRASRIMTHPSGIAARCVPDVIHDAVADYHIVAG